MVRPHLEFSQTVWSPYLLKFVDQLEGVQRRATRLIPGLSKLAYTDRLKTLKLPTLSYRRIRGDLIEVFKITKGLYDPAVTDKLLHWSVEGRTRGNSSKLFLKRSNTNFGNNCFSGRVVKHWNMLSDSVLNSGNLSIFKSRLDKFMKDQPIIYDYRSNICTNSRYY
jgi:hypothetical protein